MKGNAQGKPWLTIQALNSLFQTCKFYQGATTCLETGRDNGYSAYDRKVELARIVVKKIMTAIYSCMTKR